MNSELKKIAELLKKWDGDLGFARIDHHRQHRCGFPEVIYGAGKTAEQIIGIDDELKKCESPVLCTRTSQEKADKVRNHHPDLEYCALSQALLLHSQTIPQREFLVNIVTAGTSDLFAALEAKHTIELCGCRAELISDVGVAGLHRLLSRLDELAAADVVIVAAGMEGALPSVIGGLVRCPVIALPTSVGYGVSAGGFAALTGMLSSCAGGLTVVNIDNGFGAGCAAVRMASLIEREKK